MSVDDSFDYGHCPICRRKVPEAATESLLRYECGRCGKFSCRYKAVRSVQHLLASDRQVANASGWIREHEGIIISESDARFLASLPTPSVADRADKILLYFERTSPAINWSITFQFERPEMLPWISVSWSTGPEELSYLIFTYLFQHAHYVNGKGLASASGTQILANAQITPAGFAHLQELKLKRMDSSIGFCAMWFKPELTILWTDAIEPAIREAGYEPKRIDRVEHNNNKIDDEIVATIRRSKFIVADFTGGRGGVYFETGFALGLNIPVIWTTRAGRLNRVHFDTRQYNFLEWDGKDLGTFKNRLKNRVVASIGEGPNSQ